MRPVESDPAFERLLRETAPRASARLTGRELASEVVFALGLLVACGLMGALSGTAPALGWQAAVLVVLYALTSRVSFSTGIGSTCPTQLVLVPMLLLTPPAWVPLLVAAGFALGRLPEHLSGRAHPDRLVLHLGDAWYAVGPALVLVLAGVERPGLDDWPVLALALLAQVVADSAVSLAREWLGSGVAPTLHLKILAAIAGIDAALAPIGLLAGIVAYDEPAALACALPLVGVLGLLAHERERRLEHALMLSDAYRGSALLMGEMLEADDPYTGGEHSKGVVALGIAVGHELRLDPTEQRNLEFGALLHDIGKLKVPDEILNKPGKLTPVEWEVIKRHPEDGQRMLDQIGGALAEVGLTVRSHHERWDGGGYPDGLRGEEIPLNARIISACDAFSAMTTTRSYRKAMPQADAIAELRACAGTQFDPRVVDAVVAVVGDAPPVQPSIALAA